MNLKLRKRRLNLFKKMSYRSLPDLRLQVLSRSDLVNLDDNHLTSLHTHTHTHTLFFSLNAFNDQFEVLNSSKEGLEKSFTRCFNVTKDPIVLPTDIQTVLVPLSL